MVLNGVEKDSLALTNTGWSWWELWRMAVATLVSSHWGLMGKLGMHYVLLKKWSFCFWQSIIYHCRVDLFLPHVQSWSVKWESRVHSTICLMFCVHSTFKCWWRFCLLKLSIWEQKSSFTAVVVKVHFTCPGSGFDLLQIPEVYKSRAMTACCGLFCQFLFIFMLQFSCARSVNSVFNSFSWNFCIDVFLNLFKFAMPTSTT